MTTIYVLALEEGKYYIGKTKNLKSRLDQHFTSYGSEWTRKYKPIDVVETIDDCDDLDEEKYTLKYMNKYGVDNVRGGSFCTIELSEESKIIIKKILDNSNDKCFSCGEKGHFVKYCPNRGGWEVVKMEQDHDTAQPAAASCERCNRLSHTKDNCYAKTYADGKLITETATTQTSFKECHQPSEEKIITESAAQTSFVAEAAAAFSYKHKIKPLFVRKLQTSPTNNDNIIAKAVTMPLCRNTIKPLIRKIQTPVSTTSTSPVARNSLYCTIKCHNGQYLGWDDFLSLNLPGRFTGVNPLLVLEWINDEYFRVKHPDQDLYINANLYSCKKENAGLFKLANPVKNNKVIETFISTNNTYWWVDEKWYGYKLKNDSMNTNAWEKFTIETL